MIVTSFDVPYLFCLIASAGFHSERKFPTSGDKEDSPCSGVELRKKLACFHSSQGISLQVIGR